MSSSLLQLETELAERLESIPFFEPFASRGSIMVEPRKSLLAEINKKLGSLKTVIVPKVTGADDNHPNVNGVYFDAIRISVGVFQNPLLMGDDAVGFEICEEIHKAFKWWTPDSLVNAINPAQPGIEEIADKKLNIYSCNFKTLGGFVGELPRVATPTANDSGSSVTLSCATAGAAIFYTTNGANPIPRSATLYTGPIAYAATLNLKARAYLAGYLRSELLSGTYTPS